MPPNLGGRARADDDHKKKKRAHKKEIARVRSRFFLTREVLLDRFLKGDARALLLFFSDRFLFFILFCNCPSGSRRVSTKARWDKKRREKELVT